MNPRGGLPHVLVQSFAFEHETVPHRLNVVEQRQNFGAIAVQIGRLSECRQAPQAPDQGFAFAWCGRGHSYLMAEISVSNILLTVVMTWDAAEYACCAEIMLLNWPFVSVVLDSSSLP